MWRPALLLVASLTAGCFSDGCYGPRVTFSDDGLYEALATPPAGWVVEQEPLTGPAFDNVSAQAAYGAIVVSHVIGPATGLPVPTQGRQRDTHEARLHLLGAWMELRVPGNVSLDDVRPHVLWFLQNVTAMTPDEQEDWTGRFLATRGAVDTWGVPRNGTFAEESTPGFLMALDGPLQVDDLVRRLGGWPAPGDASARWNTAWSIQAANWTVELRAPVRTALHDGVEIRATPWGQHSADGGWDDFDEAMPGFLAAYASLGRDVPPDASTSSGRVRC